MVVIYTLLGLLTFVGMVMGAEINEEGKEELVKDYGAGVIALGVVVLSFLWPIAWAYTFYLMLKKKEEK